jgi:hypothetical protein
MAKNNTRVASAFLSTKVENAPPPLETFLNGTSSLYAEQMYEMYLEDPSSVQDSWRIYFENEENAIPFDSSDFSKPTSVPGKRSAAIAGVRCIIQRFDYIVSYSAKFCNYSGRKPCMFVPAHHYSI